MYPFGRDQGIYAYAGNMLLHGKIDYKYVFDLKPPGVHYAFALSEFFLGSPMISFRIFDLIWQVLTAMVIFIIAHRFTRSQKISLIAPLLYLFLYYRYDYWHTLQADGLLNLPFALSILFLFKIQTDDSRKFWLISGICFAITILFKYTLIIFLPLILVCFFIYRREEDSFKKYGVIYYLIGFSVVLIIITLFYIFNKASNEFFDIIFKQIPHYSKIGIETTETSFILNQIFGLFFSSIYSPLIIFAVVTSFFIFYDKKGNLQFSILLTWLVSVLINLIIQWKFFYYHFLVIIPPLSVFASLFFYNLYVKFKEINKFIYAAILMIFLCGYFAIGFKPYITNYIHLFSLINGKQNLHSLYIEKGFTSDSAFMIQNTLEAVDIVKASTYENDKIFVWGFDPVVYYLSGRESCSRFIYNYPLFWKGDNSVFRSELIQDLRNCEPKLILVSLGDPLYYISGYHEDSNLMLKRFPELKSYIDSGYIFVKETDKFLIYEKRR